MLNRISRFIKGTLMDRKLEKLSMQDRFSEIYRTGWWNDNQESVSGSGSTLDNTTLLRRDLVPFLDKWNVKRVLDAPCGDWNWMKEVALPEHIHYIGGEIVPDLVETLREKNTRQNVEFVLVDITADKLPDVDLMFCRDCLFHLSSTDIFRFIDNFIASDIPYLLTTNMPQIDTNREIVTGKHRPLNLQAAPFNLGEPLDRFADYEAPRREKYMTLWSRDQLIAARGQTA